jgi:hypothetical protein
MNFSVISEGLCGTIFFMGMLWGIWKLFHLGRVIDYILGGEMDAEPDDPYTTTRERATNGCLGWAIKGLTIVLLLSTIGIVYIGFDVAKTLLTCGTFPCN